MDDQTFSALFEGTRGVLLAYLRRAGGDEALAEDLLQECYIRLLNHPPRILDAVSSAGGELPVGPVRRWLFTTATRLLRDHWRQDRWRSSTRWEHGDEDGDAGTQPVAATPLPDRTLSGHEAVTVGFATLSPRQRSLLWLASVEEFDHMELARLFHLSPGSVRVLLHRARTRMEKALRALGMEGASW